MKQDFVADYPFYPPSLRVVRPRFHGSLVQALASADILNLTYWNPTNTVRQVLVEIRNIILLQRARLVHNAY